MRTSYDVCTELDPFSEVKPFESLDEAKKFAAEVGHFHVFEYKLEPGVAGEYPDEWILVANHHGMTDGEWEREATEDDRHV